jgi:hypothetical protein
MFVITSIYEELVLNGLKNIRTFIGDFDKKNDILGQIQEIRTYTHLAKDAALEALQSGKNVVVRNSDTGVTIIEYAIAQDVMNVYQKRLDDLNVFENKAINLYGKSTRISKYGTLEKYENIVKKWHTIDRHTNKTIEALKNRLKSAKSEDRKITASSAFYPLHIPEDDNKAFKDESRTLAEDSVGKALSYFEEEISQWLNGICIETSTYESSKKDFVINGFEIGRMIGFVIPKGQETPIPASKVRVVLEKDYSEKEKFGINTAYLVL